MNPTILDGKIAFELYEWLLPIIKDLPKLRSDIQNVGTKILQIEDAQKTSPFSEWYPGLGICRHLPLAYSDKSKLFQNCATLYRTNDCVLCSQNVVDSIASVMPK